MSDTVSRKATRRSPDERRRQIIQATIARLAREGPEGWTLRQVSRDLSVSPSLVNYFFESWGDLVVASYRDLASRFEADIAATTSDNAFTAAKRLDAYIDQYFSDVWMSDDVAGAYIAFWALARRETALSAEMARFTDAMRATLKPLVEEIAEAHGAPDRAPSIADTLYFLMNGLWYEIAVNPAILTPADAKAKLRDYLKTAFAT